MSEYSKVETREASEEKEDEENVPKSSMSEYSKVETREASGEKEDEENIPIAAALEIEDAKKDKNDDDRKMLRIVAPCALPPHHRLAVRTSDGDLLDVVIPNPGVYSGQEFEAEPVPTKAIKGRWSDSIFDCFSSDGAVFCTAWCCTGLVYAALMERLRLDWLASQGPYKSTFKVVVAIWFAYVALSLMNYFLAAAETPSAAVNLLCYGLFFYWIVILTKTRMALRRKYGIPGDCVEDCCCSYWCTCCSALQMHRHMKRSGDAARPFKDVAEAEIV